MGISCLYGLLFFIPYIIFSYSLYIERITSKNFFIILVGITILLFLFGTIGIIVLTRRWFRNRFVHFWSALLWLPACFLYLLLATPFGPVLEPEDQLSPGGGLLALFAALAYPVYILIMNLGIHAFSEGEAKAH